MSAHGWHLLQRGRAQLSAERGGGDPMLNVGESTLQRGRAQLSAESSAFAAWPPPQFALQRGRAQLSAERTLSARRNKPLSKASTGPRSIERGERLARGD